MKRYLLFQFYSYYPSEFYSYYSSGGWEDFVADGDTIEELKALPVYTKESWSLNNQIVDTTTMKIVVEE